MATTLERGPGSSSEKADVLLSWVDGTRDGMATRVRQLSPELRLVALQLSIVGAGHWPMHRILAEAEEYAIYASKGTPVQASSGSTTTQQTQHRRANSKVGKRRKN
jgi:hypothetical protein